MSARPGSVTRRGDQMPVRRSERRAGLVNRTRPVRLRRRAPFSLHRPRDRTRAREARDRGASPREGTIFSSRGEITIMRRFERCVVGGSPAARSTFSAWPRSSGLRLLSGMTQVQILSRGPRRVNPPRRGHCLENRWTGQTGWGARPLLSAIFIGS